MILHTAASFSAGSLCFKSNYWVDKKAKKAGSDRNNSKRSLTTYELMLKI